MATIIDTDDQQTFPSNDDTKLELCEPLLRPPPSEGEEDNEAPALTAETETTESEISTFAINAPLPPDAVAALKLHNDARGAKGCPPLQWDTNLVAGAQAWANNIAKLGRLQHSTGDQRKGQGENLASAWSSSGIGDPLTRATKAWLGEAKDYHGESIGQGNFAAYGHYTQCMWRSTTRVGLAVARDAKGAVYTCGRYAPAGNFTESDWSVAMREPLEVNRTIIAVSEQNRQKRSKVSVHRPSL